MIEISERAQDHFRKLIAPAGHPGARASACAWSRAARPAASCELEFCEPSELDGNEWAVECRGFHTACRWRQRGLAGGRLDRFRAQCHRRPAEYPRAEDQGRGPGRRSRHRRARALRARGRDQPADRRPRRSRQPAGSDRRRRGGAAVRRRLPWLRHGRRDPQAGHREDPAPEGAGDHRGARRHRPRSGENPYYDGHEGASAVS